jgi:RNA polymerase sigma-32 factor
LPRTTKPRETKSPRAGARGSSPSPRSTGTPEEREQDGHDGHASAPPPSAEAEAEAEDGEASAGSDEAEAEPDDEPEEDAGAEPDEDEEPERAAGSGASSAPERRSAEPASIERFDPMAAYLREVQRHPLLTAEQTQVLAEKFVATQDPAIAAKLVTANLRLVVKIAYEYRRAYKNIMDLVQEGNIGLMQAVKRYDPYRGVKLSSYAAWWIRAYILRFILNNWRLVKLGTTQTQRKLFFNLRKKRAELQAMGIDPTNEEVAKRLNVPVNEVADMEARLQASERSLDAPIGDGEGRATAKIDTMPSQTEGPEALMADSELQEMLKDKLARFRQTLVGKDKELAIFDERLVADEPLTLQELGDRFGISRERVRQVEQRLTARLREFLREEMGDAVEVS